MKYTLGFRIWHWLHAAVILGLLGTVFLRKTFLSYKTNAEILMAKLADMGTDITIEDAKILAKTIRDNMWEWHIILGYALVALVIYRIVLFFLDKSKRESFSSLSLHKKGVKSLYYLLYTTVLFMSISGFIIYFYQDLGLAKEVAKQIKELHEAAFNIIMIFVLLHVAGVIIADTTQENGLISTMINGKEVDNFK
ncbi:Cytochrome B561 [Sulfurimonas denitrificans DSM 1251]|uniref:Cytochrome B561 n=1 Tax=Sulfurimonas denitrificans (strain ATCC 33889 / DSM 1251) TaxID=326298 RepID=Q30PK3_SULDN|nr:cytochrome b/b6 domain-containing protein [Sulfurimonas denitrificans]ABB45078.1 Cytochrome B561 [Sulfurimonas denitrificans DSM 1251]MDD3442162.1 cytochrome b/b6 domain-containing protein [Sulfurimonas denitrificans]